MIREFIPNVSILKTRKGARLVRRAFSKYKWYFVLLTVLGIAAGLFESVGVNALIPLFSFFVRDEQFGSGDFITRSIEGLFEWFGINMSLPLLLGLIIILFFLKAGAKFLFNYISLKITAIYERDMKNELFANTLNASWSYLAKQKVGYLDTVIKVDTERSAQMLNQMAWLIMVIMGMFMYMLIAFNISETMTLLTIAAGIIIFFILKPLFFRARKVAEETGERYKDVAHLVNESILGIKALKIDGVEEPIARRGQEFFTRQMYLKVRMGMFKQFSTILIEPMMIVFVSGIVAFAFYQTSFNLGAIAAVIYLIQRTFVYIQQTQVVLHGLNENVPYLQSMLKYRDNARVNKEDKSEMLGIPFYFKKYLSFEQVSFTYPGTKRSILNNVSFSVHKGALVGLTGPSGAGKTTIFDLLLRLYSPTDGRIVIDGRDIGSIDLEDWRKHIAYVPQDNFLLNDTVANNIRFFDANISELDIKKAARKAHIDSLIEHKTEHGYETMLGSDGMQLSGGERQRIVIARALARKPDILLLDEATSALDTDTETEIQKVIDDLRGEITTFVIAHRPSTIEHVDILLILKDGKIIVEEKSNLL